MKLLSGKTALITGASRGIGRGIALKFAEHGANVAFTYLSSVEKGIELEKELSAFGIKAKGFCSDASDFKAAEELTNAVVAEFGTIDILVNNAGITKDNLLMRMTEEQYAYLEAVAIRIRMATGLRITRASLMLKLMEYGKPFLEKDFPEDAAPTKKRQLFG